MLQPDQYELLDFGQGRKLERFGPYVLDRQSVAANTAAKAAPGLWSRADARHERADHGAGRWHGLASLPPSWSLEAGSLRLELRLRDHGQVGIFPEQAGNWQWLGQRAQAASAAVRLLNLFAYTGASSLAAAAAGAEVVHVDSARPVVSWARRNAELSGLAGASIRWIVEDAITFCRRQLRRGQRYQAVVLDPPSYGHGPEGQAWKIQRDLLPLLRLCAELTADQRQFILLTCHTPGLESSELRDMLTEVFSRDLPGRVSGQGLRLTTADGRHLPSGTAGRWVRVSRRPRAGL